MLKPDPLVQIMNKLQSFSTFMQLALIFATFIALPVGRGANRNDGHFIFVEVQNLTTWPTGWAFMLSWLSPICEPFIQVPCEAVVRH